MELLKWYSTRKLGNTQLILHSKRFITRPHIRAAKDYHWFNLKRAELQRLTKKKNQKIEEYNKSMQLPAYFKESEKERERINQGFYRKHIEVIFLRNMDEFVAGQISTVNVGLYRQWLYPHKVAIPATPSNIERFGHLNAHLRQQMKFKEEMKKLSHEISKFRLDCKIRRDPNTGEIYSFITKPKICRQLLLYKRIEIHPQKVHIEKLSHGGYSTTDDENALEYISSEGAYKISLDVQSQDNSENVFDKFEFRMNVRSIELPRDCNLPFENERDGIGEDDESEMKKVEMTKEKRSELRTWNRAKHSHELLDDTITNRKSRYSDLYDIGKTKL